MMLARSAPLALTLCCALAACSGGSGGGTSTGGIVPQQSKDVVSVSFSGTTSFTVGIPVSETLTVSAKDGSGNVITGTYASAITLSDSDTTGATNVSPVSVTSSSTTVTLTYNGSGGFTGATISAKVSGNTVGSVALTNATTCDRVSDGASQVQGYYPCDLQDAYSLPVTSGSGQTVAIVDAYDDPNAESDLDHYRSVFGLPACTTANGCFKKVNESGQQSNYPTANAGWAGEESLDVDMVSAVCPKCHIILVEATSNSGTDLYTSENEAASLGATEISNSWGGDEYSGENTSDTSYFKHPGIVITVSAGDDGYQEGTQYPAASQYVTAVGGTSLNAAANSRGWTETVWNTSSTEGTGSGCSSYVPKPSWQTDASCAYRMGNDVAAVADPYTGVATYDTYSSGGWGVIGGTSVSSPIVAAVYALAGNAASVTYGSYPYSHASGFYDVTSGDNGTCSTAYFCTAETGYDGPTGWGTPSGVGGITGLSVHQQAPHHVLMVSRSLQHERLCAAPAPEHMACFAIRVVGAH